MKGFCVIESLAGGDLIIPDIFQYVFFLFAFHKLCVAVALLQDQEDIHSKERERQRRKVAGVHARIALEAEEAEQRADVERAVFQPYAHADDELIDIRHRAEDTHRGNDLNRRTVVPEDCHVVERIYDVVAIAESSAEYGIFEEVFQALGVEVVPAAAVGDVKVLDIFVQILCAVGQEIGEHRNCGYDDG